MATLTYSAIASLDGYVEDSAGRFDWAAPDEEVHRFVNDLERPSLHMCSCVWSPRATASLNPQAE
jgi:hypothetical protein